MTIDEYRNSVLSVELAELINKNPALQIALQVCDESSPSMGGVKDWREPHTAHIQLGLDRGYNLYGKVFRMLGTPMAKQEEQVEATYAPAEEKEE